MLDRRQFIGVVGATVLGLGLAGCGSDSGTDAQEGTGAADTTAKRKIAIFLDGPINDGGWGASCYKAMVDGAAELGWDTAYSESVAQSDWATTMTNYVDQGYDLIFAPGNQYSDTVEQVASDNPDARFVILNDTVQTDNIESLMPNTEQIGLLAGALAGVLSKKESIGFVGGVELDTTKSKLENYTKAAQKVNAAIQVTSAYAGSFSDAAKGKELGTSMVTGSGVDVMFGDASIVDTGVREALSGFDGVYDIGQPADLGGPDDPLIANSVVTDNKTMLLQAMKDVEADSYGNKVINGDLSNGGVSVGTFSSIVTTDQQAAYNGYVDQIKAGTFL
ncbi:BMP family protein [Thermophilibacter immobilis]|jgi:basic membrane protein A|uniref:BMP family protein n=1 Tax=Thermophilibacter immobilis TaxID=2779519 RepID=A0A7S7M7P2_9ACTN|nr:BMP family protein [Thermophilibacter immobilis]QOY60252.1 BMP family protein [Thermophilibacter immobilis]